jgi:hypothetical protein
LQQILAGLDQQHVHAALDQRRSLLVVGGEHCVVADVTERGQLGRRPQRAGRKAGLLRRRVCVGHFARQPRRRQIQLAGALLQIVLGKHDARGAEAVGLDHIAASLQIGRMNGANHIRPRERQHLVAALLALEILRGKIQVLQTGAHGAVINQHAPLQL